MHPVSTLLQGVVFVVVLYEVDGGIWKDLWIATKRLFRGQDKKNCPFYCQTTGYDETIGLFDEKTKEDFKIEDVKGSGDKHCCPESSICFVQRILLQTLAPSVSLRENPIRYIAGCIPANQCTQLHEATPEHVSNVRCCHDSGCNTPNFPPLTTDLKCFSSGLDTFNRFKAAKREDVNAEIERCISQLTKKSCLIHQGLDDRGDYYYSAGCLDKDKCDELHETSSDKVLCCNTTLCNSLDNVAEMEEKVVFSCFSTEQDGIIKKVNSSLSTRNIVPCHALNLPMSCFIRRGFHTSKYFTSGCLQKEACEEKKKWDPDNHVCCETDECNTPAAFTKAWVQPTTSPATTKKTWKDRLKNAKGHLLDYRDRVKDYVDVNLKAKIDARITGTAGTAKSLELSLNFVIGIYVSTH